MRTYDYLENVKEDVRNYIEENKIVVTSSNRTVDLCISNFGKCSHHDFNHSIYGERLRRAINIVSINK